MSMTFIYIHGFNSDGEGWKAAALRRQFPAATVWAPDLPANPEEVQKILATFIEQSQATIVLTGTSLGGFYAYYNAAKYQLPAFLFNPSLSPHETLDGRGIGQFQTWTKGRAYHFKKSYLPVLAGMKKEAAALITQNLLHFFLATDDDILDHRPLPALFPEAHIRWFTDTGHGFSKFEKVLKLIKRENLVE